MQDVLHEWRHQHREVHPEGRDEADHGDREQHGSRLADVANALAQVLNDLSDGGWSHPAWRRMELALAHEEEPDDDGNEAEAVDQERDGDAEHADRETSHSG